MTVHKIEDRPIHLGLGASSHVLPQFTGEMQWYEDYMKRHGSDGHEGRLVSMHTFTESWAEWEVHPNGSEVVICVAGEMRLLQELPDGSVETVHLSAGDYIINPPGIWHTADIDKTATAMFITAGEGTEGRPRT
ncbi:MAG: cupin domain-containing protein [Pseudomonadota bacterium]